MTTPAEKLTITQAAALYSQLTGRRGLVWRTRMCRLVSAGKFGVEGVDWGRVGTGKTCPLWVTADAVRRFAAAVVADRLAHAERKAAALASMARKARKTAKALRGVK